MAIITTILLAIKAALISKALTASTAAVTTKIVAKTVVAAKLATKIAAQGALMSAMVPAQTKTEQQQQQEEEDPCSNIRLFTATPQMTTRPDKFTGADILISLNPFKIEPAQCKINYECESVVSASAFAPTCADLFGISALHDTVSYTFRATGEHYQSARYAPGTYEVKIKGYPVRDSSKAKRATIKIELLDPCDPPMSLKPSEVYDPLFKDGAKGELNDFINYQLRQNNDDDVQSTVRSYKDKAVKLADFLKFTVTPSYCPVHMDVRITPLADVQNAIKPKGAINLLDKIDWDGDNLKLAETNKVTITGTTYSKYKRRNAPLKQIVEQTFKTDLCQKEMVTIALNSQTNPEANAYTGTDFKFTHNRFTIQPSHCKQHIRCASVYPHNEFMPCQDFDESDQLTWNFPSERYTDQQVPPGDYTYTFQVSSTEDYDADYTQEFTVLVTLKDPCTDAVPTLPTPQPITYFLTDEAEVQIMSPGFSIEPVWCNWSSTNYVPQDSDMQNDIVYEENGEHGGITGQKFTVGPIFDRLTPSNPKNDGLTEQEVPVTTTFKVCNYDGACREYPVVTPVTVKNPCMDLDYVNIAAPFKFAPDTSSQFYAGFLKAYKGLLVDEREYIASCSVQNDDLDKLVYRVYNRYQEICPEPSIGNLVEILPYLAISMADCPETEEYLDEIGDSANDFLSSGWQKVIDGNYADNKVKADRLKYLSQLSWDNGSFFEAGKFYGQYQNTLTKGSLI